MENILYSSSSGTGPDTDSEKDCVKGFSCWRHLQLEELSPRKKDGKKSSPSGQLVSIVLAAIDVRVLAAPCISSSTHPDKEFMVKGVDRGEAREGKGRELSE
jgi:hypothetical protein